MYANWNHCMISLNPFVNTFRACEPYLFKIFLFSFANAINAKNRVTKIQKEYLRKQEIPHFSLIKENIDYLKFDQNFQIASTQVIV